MYLANLGATGLWDNDETIYSSIAREMAVRGDWIVPTFNGALFPEKPPLVYWLSMGSFNFLGVSEFAARLPAAILAIGTALATYHLARRLFSANVGFWAGLIVASNIIFTVSARAATVDSALTFITTLVMLLFAQGARLGCGVRGARNQNGNGALREAVQTQGDGEMQFHIPCATHQSSSASLHAPYVPTSWPVYIAIGALLGLAILAKGPVGFLLPAASLGLFLLVMREKGDSPHLPTRCAGAPRPEGCCAQMGTVPFFPRIFSQLAATFSPRRVLRVLWSMRPLTVLAVAALVALPWFVAVTVKTDGQWLAQFVTKYNLGPFVKPFLGHRGPWYYHFVVVLAGFFPWSVFLGPTVVRAWRAVRHGGPEAPSYWFLVCWIGVFFGFWTVCSTKLPHYVLPAYPALAILTACFLDAWLNGSEVVPRYVMPVATAIFLVVGVLMLAVLPGIAARYVPGEQIIALVGLAPLLGGGAAMYFLVRRAPAFRGTRVAGRRSAYLAAIAASSVLLIVAIFAWAAVRIDRHQHSRPLLASLRDNSPAAPQIAGYKYCNPGLVYYAGGPVAEIADGGQLRRFVAQSPHPYVITTGDVLSELETQMPGQWRIVASRPRFLGTGQIVVLAPRPISTARAGSHEL